MIKVAEWRVGDITLAVKDAGLFLYQDDDCIFIGRVGIDEFEDKVAQAASFMRRGDPQGGESR